MLNTLKKEYSDVKVGEITVGQVIGGMRGMLGMVYETSKLHPMNGINYTGHDLFEIIKKTPRTHGSQQPSPEAILWLLLTTDFPTEKELADFEKEL